MSLVAGEKTKKKETSSESEQASDSEEEFSSSEMMNFVRKKMHRCRRYNKKVIKSIFNDNKKRGKSPIKSKLKSKVFYFECNRKGHYKANCPELIKQKHNPKKKRALKLLGMTLLLARLVLMTLNKVKSNLIMSEEENQYDDGASSSESYHLMMMR